MDKPVTMLIEEFKTQFVKDINESKLPLWLIVSILSPYLEKLDSLAKLQAEADKNKYLESLKGETEDGISEQISGSD